MHGKTITIEIEPDGSSSINLDGYQGKGCDAVLRALQGTDEQRAKTLKREYHEQECEPAKVRLNG